MLQTAAEKKLDRHAKPCKKRGAQSVRANRRLIFYTVGIALPILQFCIFYIGVNFNSILLSFQKYNYFSEAAGKYSFAGLDNFKAIFSDFKEYVWLRKSVGHSFQMFGFSLAGIAFSLLFSFYIYKKYLGNDFFRTVLFLPQVISAIIMVTLYKYFVENCIPAVWEKVSGVKITGLLSSVSMKQTFYVIIFYCVFSSFGTQVLLFSGAMSGIPESVTEAAQLDGVTPLKEFVKITVPMIFSNVTTFVVVAVAGIFTHQMNLYGFYGSKAEYQLYTIGYYLYKGAQTGSRADYPYYAAFGLLLTVISVPLTMGAKKLLEKFGSGSNR